MAQLKKILVLNGPNLNLLGKREPGIYGSVSLEDINITLKKLGADNSVDVEVFQSNSESELIDKITSSNAQFILFNPAAYTHTSVAIRDALLGVSIPFIEVHISNIFSREEFRKQSYFSDIAKGVVTGLGVSGYTLSMEYAINYLNETS